MKPFTFIKTKQLLEKKKVWLKILVIPFLLTCLVGAKSQEKTTEAQTWTSLTGHQIVAEFVEIKGENLILKDEDGAQRSVRLPMLITTDQARAKELQKNRPREYETELESSSTGRLPRFLVGEAKGYHAVYSHEKFTAKVLNNGYIQIQCLEDGKAVGKPIRFSVGHSYYNKKRKRRQHRTITQYQKSPTPTVSPTLLEYEATLDNEAITGFNYAFIDNTLQMWGWVVDPPQNKEPTRIGFGLRFSPSHVFPPEKTVAEQKETLKPYGLEIYPIRGSSTRIPYADKAQAINTLQRIAIDGPFGKRQITVEARSTKNTWLYFYIYRDFAPYQGYSISFRKKDNNSKFDAERLVVTID